MSARLLHGIVFSVCHVCCANAHATGLLDAVKHNEKTAVAALIALGANVNEQGPQSDTPLHWAAFNGNPELVQSLIDAGANTNDRLGNGNTPLHLAAYKGHIAVVETLLQLGADATLRNREGNRPLELARQNQHQAAIDLLTRVTRQYQAAIPSSQPRGAALVPSPVTPATNSAPETSRIQLMAVTSEERAQHALVDYRGRFADILTQAKWLVERVVGSTVPLYRVQYGPLSLDRAETLCAELKRREQPCLVRTIP